jgi:hypothetical protein
MRQHEAPNSDSTCQSGPTPTFGHDKQQQKASDSSADKTIQKAEGVRKHSIEKPASKGGLTVRPSVCIVQVSTIAREAQREWTVAINNPTSLRLTDFTYLV